MKAIVTSIGERTTDLCVWALERNGFEVQLVYNEITTLAQKLEYIYTQVDKDFLRVDADIVVNKNCIPENIKYVSESDTSVWWWQFQCFDWFQQDVMNGGVQFIRKPALQTLRNKITEHLEDERPETSMYRLDSFMNPRRCVTNEEVMGIHGFMQNDVDRVKETKERRDQWHYDFELAQKLEELCLESFR